MIGRSILHYTIEAELGAGSMGRVYRARDTLTARDVALKFLGSARDETSRARILREGRATARLSHPGIATLYAIEEDGGEIFLVQELVTGESLDARIARERLTVPEAMRLARELAAALAHAHRNGVLHRDLKPSNIVVSSDGACKIVDFGISHIEGATTLTGRDSVTGTLPYMAPERIKGDPGDARSDLFSLGAVLYETLTGRRAFPGHAETEIVMRILNEDPPLLQLPGSAGATFAAIIASLVAKDGRQRPESAEQLRAMLDVLAAAGSQALPAAAADSRAITLDKPPAKVARPGRAGMHGPARRLVPWAVAVLLVAMAMTFAVQRNIHGTVPGGGAAPAPVAVLYFENVTDPRDADRIGAIASHLLVTSLAQNASLDILSTQTVLDALYRVGARGERVDRETAMKVAHAVKAGRIITGSILQVHPYIVMTTEVTDVRTGRVVHAARVEGRPGQEIFGVVDELSSSVMNRLSPGGARPSLQPVSQQASGNMGAMRLYVEGIEHLASGELHPAEQSFEAALETDPAFPQALFSLSIVRWWLNEPVSAQATAAAALRVSDRLSPRDRDFVRGVSELAAGRYEDAARILKPMAARYPGDKMVAYGLVECAFHSEDWEGAVELARRTLEIDPTFSLAAVHLVDGLANSSRAPEAEATARRFLAESPQNEPLRRSLFMSLIMQGKGDAVIAAANDAADTGVSTEGTLLAAALVAIDRGTALDRIDPRWYQAHDSSTARDRAAALEYWQALHRGRFRQASDVSDRAWAARGRKDNPALADGLGAAFAVSDPGRMAELIKRVSETLLANPLWRPLGLLVPVYCSYRLGVNEDWRRDLDRIGALPDAERAAYRAPMHFMKALAAGRDRRTAEALQLLQDARTVGPPLFGVGSMGWARARILLDGGRYEAALAQIDTLLGAPVIDPYDAVLLRFQRGQALEQLGRRDEARVAYREFLEIWKNADRETPEVTEARRALARL